MDLLRRRRNNRWLQEQLANEALTIQRMESLLALNHMGDQPQASIIARVVEDATRLTESTIGYLAMLNEDESVMTMKYWSESVHAACKMVDKPFVYPVAKLALLAESVRQRKTIIINDYAAPNPKKGCTPEGHIPITRYMSIPVFDGAKIVALAGVGNKQLGIQRRRSAAIAAPL